MNNPFDTLDQRLENIEKCLSELMNIGRSSPELSSIAQEELTLDIQSLAKYLNCAKSTVHRYKNNKVFPFYKAGRTVFFKKSEVDSAMSSCKVRNKKGVKTHG